MSRMGRGYRRGSAVCHTSFTIDKLFKESNNKPSAARSAGTVGKWGITSFTTIRGSGFSSSKLSSKNERKEPSNDGYAFNAEGTKPKDEPPKPKKFFKSRNTGPAAEVEATSKNVGLDAKKPKDDANVNKKLSPKSSPHSDNEYKPPIVLRIFKGTSCLVADDSSASPPVQQSPRGDKSPSSKGRRRSTHEEPSWSPKGRRRSAVEDTPPPVSQRPKRACRDPAIQNIMSQLLSEDEGDESGFESQILPPPPAVVPSVEDNSEDSLPLASTEFYRQGSANKENELKSLEVEKRDAEILAQGQTLLSGTAFTPMAIEEDVSHHELDSVEPSAVVATRDEDCKMDADNELESDEDDTDSQEQPDSGVMMTSQVDGGGLKLVIKKAPDPNPHISPQQTDHETAKVVPQKKKSIFKSRRQDDVGNAKRLALYKHNWDGALNEPNPEPTPAASHSFPDTEASFTAAALTRVPSEPRPGSPADDIAKVKCEKTDKGFYTVIRNVKKAHQIQESGEFQELNDDVEYILDTLRDNNPVGTRCLSAITLAGRCMAPAFRMHVRAHGTVAKFFRALHDATKDQSLGLCTATVMFVLSQDRLNMDLDRDSLELMLGLLESDASHANALDDCGLSSAQLHKNKQKVRELCAEIQGKGLAKHLNLDNITVGQLAMETLLSLTSRRAGEWFKEELRELGGLDHIIRTIAECCRHLDTYISQWTDPLLDRLRKIDRCLRVLENVMSQNEENQNYLLRFENGLLPTTVITLYKVCNDEIALYPCTDSSDKVSTGFVLREALLSVLKVLIQLTQDLTRKSFSEALRNGRVQIVDSSLHLLLQVPNYIPEEDKFDFIVLVLTLLINLLEDSEENRVLLMESKAPPDPESIIETREEIPAVLAMVQLFYSHVKRALEEEAQTDAILDGKKDEKPEEANAPVKSKGEEIEETIAKLLKKAGNHMEHTFIGAYIAIVLGYLVQNNKERENAIRVHLPDLRFTEIIAVLEKFVNFMKMTAYPAMGNSHAGKGNERILNYYIQIEKEFKVDVKEEPTDLSIPH